MKKIILTLMVAAFVVAVQAETAKNCPLKDQCKPACCSVKAKNAEQAKAECCPLGKSFCNKKAAAKQACLKSPKAADTAN